MSQEDEAQRIELEQWERNNTPRAEKTRFKPGEPGYGPEFCKVDVCEQPIPAGRRQWGLDTCVACARIIELRQSRYAAR